MEPLAWLLAGAGLALGLAADRFATRWPEHDEEHPPGRRVDWRTAVTAVVGAVAFGLLPLRFGTDPLAFALFGAWFVTLVIGLATDLDQRLLPDALTLPVIPIALVYALSGQNPLVGTDLLFTLVAAIAVPLVLYLPSIPFGAGAFGLGDVKLLIGVGLLTGAARHAGRGRVRPAAGGRRAGGAARDPADRPADVRAVRAVLHPGRPVGRAHPPVRLLRVPARSGPSGQDRMRPRNI